MTETTQSSDAHATQTASTIAVGTEAEPVVTQPNEVTEKSAAQTLYGNEEKAEDKKVESPPKEVTPSETEKKDEQEKTDERKDSEKYELKLAENSLLEKKVVDEIAEFAKSEGLSKEQAQKLLDRESNAVMNYRSKLESDLHVQGDTWYKEVQNDKELGGDNFNRTAELSKRVINKFGTDQFKQVLNQTRTGNHIEFVRFVSRIGEAMGDDVFHKGDNPRGGGVERSAADILYGKNN